MHYSAVGATALPAAHSSFWFLSCAVKTHVPGTATCGAATGSETRFRRTQVLARERERLFKVWFLCLLLVAQLRMPRCSKAQTASGTCTCRPEVSGSEGSGLKQPKSRVTRALQGLTAQTPTLAPSSGARCACLCPASQARS